TVVDAVVTVTASGSGLSGSSLSAANQPPSAAEVLMIDCSGSMNGPPTKIAEAKKATMTAIDTLRDGVAFAIVAGRDGAALGYPPAVQLEVANPQTRQQAKAAVARLRASGGTAIGTWLTLANHVFARSNAKVKHAIMLTDGRNQHESAEQLAAVLR